MRLRFDFSHFAGVAEEELAEVESIVNAQVLKNTPVQTMVDVPIDVAVHELGATALFGEKYGELVRVVKIGEFSTELCGGNAYCGDGRDWAGEAGGRGSGGERCAAGGGGDGDGRAGAVPAGCGCGKGGAAVCGGGEVSAEALKGRVTAQEEELKRLRRELEQMKMKSASAATADAAGSAGGGEGVKVLRRESMVWIRARCGIWWMSCAARLGSGVVVLGAAGEGRFR